MPRRPSQPIIVFQHTAARRRLGDPNPMTAELNSFNTQPPEGGWGIGQRAFVVDWFQHTAARRRLALVWSMCSIFWFWFQHTAARRRLDTKTAEKLTVIGAFQHTAARRRLAKSRSSPSCSSQFQHTAARRRLGNIGIGGNAGRGFNTQPPEGGGKSHSRAGRKSRVSTHSRPKAAGDGQHQKRHIHHCFNTQPPEGGWDRQSRPNQHARSFNTQPPEGGWLRRAKAVTGFTPFQHTAARRRLGMSEQTLVNAIMAFQHTAARRRLAKRKPKSATNTAFQHTAARRRLEKSKPCAICMPQFQHTAARRRLAGSKITLKLGYKVSTHSRPKAAGF